MTHEEAQLLMGATPAEVGPALAEHLARCPSCVLFQQQMRRMDHDLANLFAAPPPPRADTRILSLSAAPAHARAPGFSRLIGLAAGVVLAMVLGIVLWTLRPQPSLAAAVLVHVTLESGSWSGVTPMTGAATAQVLTGAGVTVDPADTTVTYARSCLFNGHWVPHLVIQTTRGPITVMVLRQEHVATRQSFHMNGYSGTLMPAPAGGTLAVIARGDSDMTDVVHTLNPHLHWMH